MGIALISVLREHPEEIPTSFPSMFPNPVLSNLRHTNLLVIGREYCQFGAEMWLHLGIGCLRPYRITVFVSFPSQDFRFS
jgi:hypothetical protein